jgi:hypothetical protein
MEYIPEKTAKIKPYGFEDASGVTVKLDANESFISLPASLREKLADIAMNAEYNRYPDPLSSSACNVCSLQENAPEAVIARSAAMTRNPVRIKAAPKFLRILFFLLSCSRVAKRSASLAMCLICSRAI